MGYMSLRALVILFILSHVHCGVINIVTRGETRTQSKNNSDNIDKLRHLTDIQRDEIVTYLLQNSANNQDFNKPSTEFMIKVFKSLQHGTQLAAATGHTGKRTPGRMRSADTIRSFSAKRESDHFKIDIPALPPHEKVRIAELRYFGNKKARRRIKMSVRIQYGGNTVEHSQTLNFSTYLTNSDGNYITDITRKLSSNSIGFHSNISLTIVHENAKTIHENGNDDNKMMIVLYNNDKAFMKDFYERVAESDQGQKVIRYKRDLLQKDSEKKGRKRRKNKWRKKKNKKDMCQLYDFKVDFDLIGWGPWIIHPKTFNSKVCYGQCPEPIGNEYTPTNHAMLQTLMRMKRPLSAPEPCCVPTKLRPLSMLYFEYDDIVVRHHEDMVATACGCR